jgi:transcriptional antiterminator NusG
MTDTEDLSQFFVVKTTANREEQVVEYLAQHAEKKKVNIYSVFSVFGTRGYIFVEAQTRRDVEEGLYNVPYSRSILPRNVPLEEIEPLVIQEVTEINAIKHDIVEIISGPFKREKAKITRVDQAKQEVVVELLDAAVPIPITLSSDSVKVIRRDSDSSLISNN